MRFSIGDSVIVIKDCDKKWFLGKIVPNDSEGKDYKVELLLDTIYLDEHELRPCQTDPLYTVGRL